MTDRDYSVSDYSVSGSRTIFTYVYLYQAAQCALEQAKKSDDCSFSNCMSVIVFSAFCLEAYINYIGENTFSYWNILERLQPKEKLTILNEHYDELSYDSSRRPFQTFSEIFKIRNLIVHGKPQTIVTENDQKLSEGEYPEEDKAKIEEICKITNAHRFFEDTEAMIKHIHLALRYGDQPFFVFSRGTATTTKV